MLRLKIGALLFVFFLSSCNTTTHENSNSEESLLFETGVIENLPKKCAAANNWVKSHSKQLNFSIAEIVSVPKIYRKYLFIHASPEQKFKMWKSHLEYALQDEMLNASQKAHLSKVLNFLSADFFSQPSMKIPLYLKRSIC